MKSFEFPKKVAFIVAHPDDETELAAGFLYENTKNGGQSSIYCATKGEKGTSYLKENLHNLGEVREAELKKAGQMLGVTDVVVSDLPDGGLESHIEQLEREVLDFLKERDVDLIVSFGEDGYSGHKDHIVLGAIAKDVAQKLKKEFMEFSKPPEEECTGFHQFLYSKRKNGKYIDVVESKANIKVKINKEIKLRVMEAHETQHEGLNPYNVFPEHIADHLLEYEYFYIQT